MRIRAREGRALNPSKRDVDVFQAMRRILVRWRDDPEKLAIAVVAYEDVLGYNCAAWEVGGWSGTTALSDTEASVRVRHALYRRNRRTLRHRAEGLVLALQEVAEDAEAWRLHGARLESCVIECRELEIDERLEALRAREVESP
jgi:hypothetical protein